MGRVIGRDANVFVRYIAQDEIEQSIVATRFVESLTAAAPGVISTVTLVETVRVLTRAYKTPRPLIAQILEGLLRSRELVVQDPEMHHLALGSFQAGSSDYADAIIDQTGRNAGCRETVTFDKQAAAVGMRLLS